MDCSLPDILYPWDSSGKNTEVGCYSLFQEIFPTQGSNLGLLHCKQILYDLSHHFFCFDSMYIEETSINFDFSCSCDGFSFKLVYDHFPWYSSILSCWSWVQSQEAHIDVLIKSRFWTSLNWPFRQLRCIAFLLCSRHSWRFVSFNPHKTAWVVSFTACYR